ncbi:MAG: hypothetical protein ABIL58_17545 [Pseudomonadota bacterium]
MNASKYRRLIGLFILGCLLFNYPILSIFDRAVLIGGIPLLYLYLFTAWAVVIMLIALICRPRRDESDRA